MDTKIQTAAEITTKIVIAPEIQMPVYQKLAVKACHSTTSVSSSMSCAQVSSDPSPYFVSRSFLMADSVFF